MANEEVKAKASRRFGLIQPNPTSERKAKGQMEDCKAEDGKQIAAAGTAQSKAIRLNPTESDQKN